MLDDFRDALTDDFMSVIEAAILSGGLDELVLERIMMLQPCRTPWPKVRRRMRYDPGWQN